jgi:hypothetical protein
VVPGWYVITLVLNRIWNHKGTFGIAQGTLTTVPGTFGIFQGTFGIVPGTFSANAMEMSGEVKDPRQRRWLHGCLHLVPALGLDS